MHLLAFLGAVTNCTAHLETKRGQTYTIDKMDNSRNTSVYNRSHGKNFKWFRPT